MGDFFNKFILALNDVLYGLNKHYSKFSLRAFSISPRPPESLTITPEDQKLLVRQIAKIAKIFKIEEENNLDKIEWDALRQTYEKLRQIEMHQYLNHAYVSKYEYY